MWDDFRLNDLQKYPLQGNYDILRNEKLLVLKYFDFIPFVRYNPDTNVYEPPIDYRYKVYFQGSDNQRKYLEYSGNEDFELNEKFMQHTGGTLIFRIPEEVLSDSNEFLLYVEAKKQGKNPVTFMRQSQLDLVLQRDIDRGIIMESGQSKDILAYI